ncbi:MAG: MFS transporter [Gammaproteobacteria bacterium]|jgi:predicted MFS family arabinose efflux permease|nr:MFS transporter [Gammaproteobacteria bacterium]
MPSLKDWLPALCGMMCLGLGAGLIGVYGFFVAPLVQEFGVSTAVVNMGPVLLLLVPGIVSPFVGKLADRLPVRRMVLFGAALAMGALLLITRMPSLWLMGLCFLLFSLGLTFYGPVVINGLMVKCYPGREARALAIAAIGISVASATLPPMMGFLLSYLEWRAALATLAGAVFVALWAGALAGLPGEVVGTVASDAAPGQPPVDADIYRRREFWLVGLCSALGLGVSVVLAVVYPPHFLAEGYTLAQAGWFLSLAGMAGMAGKLSVAWLGSAANARAKWLAMALLGLQVIGFALLMGAQNTPGVIAGLCFLGFGGGAFLTMQGYLNSRYYDASVISRVIGAQMPLFMPFGLVGAPLAGYLFDRTGSYEPMFMLLSGLLLLAILLAWLLPASRP